MHCVSLISSWLSSQRFSRVCLAKHYHYFSLTTIDLQQEVSVLIARIVESLHLKGTVYSKLYYVVPNLYDCFSVEHKRWWRTLTDRLKSLPVLVTVYFHCMENSSYKRVLLCSTDKASRASFERHQNEFIFGWAIPLRNRSSLWNGLFSFFPTGLFTGSWMAWQLIPSLLMSFTLECNLCTST